MYTLPDFCFFFFFSSRRRHTRCLSDWSSDVCSSDLSSIHRIQLVLDLAEEYGRRVAVIGRSMVSVTEIAHAHGLLSIPDGILLRPQDVMGLAREKVAILVSGTQGEPM